MVRSRKRLIAGIWTPKASLQNTTCRLVIFICMLHVKKDSTDRKNKYEVVGSNVNQEALLEV